MRLTLSQWRSVRGMSLTDAADQVGVHENTLLMWEMGTRPLSHLYLCKLCTAYGITTDDVRLK